MECIVVGEGEVYFDGRGGDDDGSSDVGLVVTRATSMVRGGAGFRRLAFAASAAAGGGNDEGGDSNVLGLFCACTMLMGGAVTAGSGGEGIGEWGFWSRAFAAVRTTAASGPGRCLCMSDPTSWQL
jgi:hypothetical protein